MIQQDDIDEILRDEAARWRAGARTDVPPARVAPALAKTSRTFASLVTVLAAAAVILIAAVLVLSRPNRDNLTAAATSTPTLAASASASAAAPVASEPPMPSVSKPPTTAGVSPTPAVSPSPDVTDLPPSQSWLPIPPLSALVRDGDVVEGRGYIKGSPGDLRLCQSFGHLLPGRPRESPRPTPTPHVACPPEDSVPVTGVAAADLPDWNAQADGSGSSTYVSARGTLNDGTLIISQVSAVTQDDESAPVPASCLPPAGGWPGDVPIDINGESALRTLADFLDAHSDIYTDYWRTMSSDSRVSVVGTTADVATAQAQVAEIFPFNLCVVEVAYARDELDAAQERLALPAIWSANQDPSIDRIVVTVPYVDDALVAEFGSDARYLVVDALVRGRGAGYLVPGGIVNPDPQCESASPTPSVSPPASPLDPEAAPLSAIEAVNGDTANFGGTYIDDQGRLVIQYVGENAGRAAVERVLTPDVAVCWVQVARSIDYLDRIKDAITAEVQGAGNALQFVFAISIDTLHNQVGVSVGPGSSAEQVSALLADYGEAVRVEFQPDVIVTLPGSPTP